MTHKMLNGHCVPISTPDNYFEIEAKNWLAKHRILAQVGARIRAEMVERQLFPDPENGR